MNMNSFINDLKMKNYESCKDLLIKTYNKINKYKIDFEKKKRNTKISKNFLQELDFILKKLKKILQKYMKEIFKMFKYI